MASFEVQYFLGANSPAGFYSLYDQMIDRTKARRLYILKGGPGCGKSTLMRRVAERAKAAGQEVEYILCSGDPDSLDAVILPAKNGCAVQRIRSFSTRFPSQAGSAPTDGDFAARVAGEVWLLPSLPGLPAASCVFSERGKGQGALEVTGPGLRLTADYVLRGPDLTFSVRKEDARMLEACGAEVLPRMLASVRSWSLEGGALTLTSADGQSFLLEKAAPDRRAGSGRAAAPKGYKR